jgi:FMN phosphatase YigB (HAD superfamily)
MKYVAFDIGNVLVYSNFNDFLKKLSKSLNLTMEEAMYFMNRSQKLHDLGLTNMSDELRDHFKIKSPVTMEELIGQWNEVIKPADFLLDKIDKLEKEHRLKIALLSNVGVEHSVRMKEVLGGHSFFKNAIKFFSCDVGARKPTILYYHTFIKLHPEFWGCPYIDDLQENLDVGGSFGLNPYRFSLEELTNDANWEEKVAKLEAFILNQHDV